MNQKGFVNVILVIIIIVLAGALGYFTLVKKSPQVTQQTPTLTPKLLSYQTPNDKAKESGLIFKFQYPSGFSVEEGGYKTPAGYRWPSFEISKIGGTENDKILIPGGVSTGLAPTCQNQGPNLVKCIEVPKANNAVVLTKSNDPAVLYAFDVITNSLEVSEYLSNNTTNITCTDKPEGTPVITSLSTYSGPVGTKFEIRGCNFSGFEGDKNAWIENASGVKGFLPGEVGSTSKLLKVTLKSPLCQKDTTHSGRPCDARLTLTPGIYKIYAMPWGKVSNKVNFTITP
jgi:hypothetical protein